MMAMNETHHQADGHDEGAFAAAEAALLAAGVDFTVVERCPSGNCPMCTGRPLADAA